MIASVRYDLSNPSGKYKERAYPWKVKAYSKITSNSANEVGGFRQYESKYSETLKSKAETPGRCCSVGKG